jgi:hypothetical protein
MADHVAKMINLSSRDQAARVMSGTEPVEQRQALEAGTQQRYLDILAIE